MLERWSADEVLSLMPREAGDALVHPPGPASLVKGRSRLLPLRFF